MLGGGSWQLLRPFWPQAVARDVCLLFDHPMLSRTIFSKTWCLWRFTPIDKCSCASRAYWTEGKLALVSLRWLWAESPLEPCQCKARGGSCLFTTGCSARAWGRLSSPAWMKCALKIQVRPSMVRLRGSASVFLESRLDWMRCRLPQSAQISPCAWASPKPCPKV